MASSPRKRRWALQETVLLNGLVVAAVWMLLVVRRSGAPMAGLGAGIALGFAVLTTARIAVFLPLAVGWTALNGGPTWRAGLRSAGLVALPIALLVGGWTLRNWQTVG